MWCFQNAGLRQVYGDLRQRYIRVKEECRRLKEALQQPQKKADEAIIAESNSFSLLIFLSTVCMSLERYYGTHTYPHIHFMALLALSGIIQVSRYQNQSGFCWSKRQWVAVASSGPYANLHITQTDNHASTPPLSFFYRLDALRAAQPTA